LKNGKTPLLAACGNADVETVSLLIQAGAVVDDSSCWDGFTALGHACRTGSLALTRLLLERGASPIKVDSTGWSPVANAQMFSMCDVMDPMYGERVQLLHELENAVANLAKGELQ
jgi:Ankyrin repeats (3 copies)